MKHMECSLNITQLTKADGQYQYYCRIITNVDKQKMTGTPGISLKITDLQIVSSSQERVKEGNLVTLTCNTTCNLPDSSSFTWSKDGRPVEEKQIIYNQLQLHPVSYEDEGSYTCAVKGHEGFPSPPMKMKVMCPTVVFSDIEDAVEGDAVTLTCNTTCNVPDSPSFTWSKDGRPVEAKQIINNQLQLLPVTYEDEGSYTCAVKGHEGLPTPPYRLQVMITPSPVKSNLVIAVLVGVAVCGVVGLLFVLYWLRSHKRNSNRAQEGDQECQDDVQYSNINFQRSGGQSGGAARPPSAAAAAAGGTDGDVLYANFQPRGSRQTARSQGDNVCYASVQIDTNSAGKSYPEQPEGEPSVIYSSVQKRV
ncbi:B-cell receptor CD22-like [Sardina pilchardus]|uniref:B-cell receptor CD22-like n=1 Tax=Sardina pilchardus TaxID=27697 RepID=UPI002E10E7AD